jgi:hypothetical protein
MLSSTMFLITTEKYETLLFDVRHGKHFKVSEKILSQFYDKHVQELYDYGMHLSSDRDFVKNELIELFKTFRSNFELYGTERTIRAYLFKNFRKHLVKKTAGCQNEVVFLKLRIQFSYPEIADILNVNVRSVHELLSQQLKTASMLDTRE